MCVVETWTTNIVLKSLVQKENVWSDKMQDGKIMRCQKLAKNYLE
jgi:hypothetical protein